MQIIQHTDEVTGSDGDVMSLSGTLEAMHSVDLAHPNVVQTYKSAQKTPNSVCPARLPVAACARDARLRSFYFCCICHGGCVE